MTSRENQEMKACKVTIFKVFVSYMKMVFLYGNLESLRKMLTFESENCQLGLFQCKGLEEAARHEFPEVTIPPALDHFAPLIRQYIFVLLSSDHFWTQNSGFNFFLCFEAIVFLLYIVLRIFVLHDW